MIGGGVMSFEVFAIILTFIICLVIIDDIDDGIRQQLLVRSDING